MFRLKSIEIINSDDRIIAVDIYRGIAIIAVVLFHFNGFLPYGYIGVDLFFVISGLLVGGIITKAFQQNNINYFKFILQRGFKIWPSYYAFLILASLIVRFIYSDSHPDQIIELWDLKRYLFFYQNYTGIPFHWSFDHVWSICVEEHFYIILPILFIMVSRFKRNKVFWIFCFTISVIILGFIFKYLSLEFTNGKDTYSATHNRIDALAWGVLLNLIITYYGNKVKELSIIKYLFVFGLILLIGTIYFDIIFKSIFYKKVVFNSLVPISFFMMILGTYYLNFEKFKLIRFIAYYSYNWYLWHPIFVYFISDSLGVGILGLMVYLIVSLFFAVLATIFIEEMALSYRNVILNKIFN
jgi:peptidoglycan/LPS O-acetylase OafA/YrhL